MERWRRVDSPVRRITGSATRSRILAATRIPDRMPFQRRNCSERDAEAVRNRHQRVAAAHGVEACVRRRVQPAAARGTTSASTPRQTGCSRRSSWLALGQFCTRDAVFTRHRANVSPAATRMVAPGVALVFGNHAAMRLIEQSSRAGGQMQVEGCVRRRHPCAAGWD